MPKVTTKRGSPGLLSKQGKKKAEELSKKLTRRRILSSAAKAKRTSKRGAPKPRKRK